MAEAWEKEVVAAEMESRSGGMNGSAVFELSRGNAIQQQKQSEAAKQMRSKQRLNGGGDSTHNAHNGKRNGIHEVEMVIVSSIPVKQPTSKEKLFKIDGGKLVEYDSPLVALSRSIVG